MLINPADSIMESIDSAHQMLVRLSSHERESDAFIPDENAPANAKIEPENLSNHLDILA